MKIVESIESFSAIRQRWKNETIAFVPTMGALHGGHLSLMEKAKSVGSKVIVSIYVNPLQFGPNEDFQRYPRTREADLELCESLGVDLVFYPDTQALHPKGWVSLTQVVPPIELVNQFCGLSRPGHFTGVATIVLKLFQLVQPQFAIFGEKDAQQFAVIRRMVSDLNLPVQIVPAPTVREPDGLAKSSRNSYLSSASDRHQARLLFRLLATIQELYKQGMETTDEALKLAMESVLNEGLYPDFQLEYLGAVHRETFLPTEILDEDTRILVAAQIGNVRLIDNTLINEPLVLPDRDGALMQLTV